MKRIVVVLACVLLWAIPAQAQVSLAQPCVFENDLFSVATSAVSLGSPTTVGNHIIVTFGFGTGARTISSMTDDGSGGSNTYAETVAKYTVTGANYGMTQWAAAVTNVSQTVTTVLSGSAGTPNTVMVCEVANLVTPIAVDDSETATTTGVTTHETADITTTTANSFLSGFVLCGNGSYTNDADFTQVTTWSNGLDAYDILSATATLRMTVTSAANETCGNMLAAYQGEASGGTCTGGLTLLGAGKCDH